MPSLKDYYSTLSVKPAANADEIKRSYRKLAMKYHPDKNLNDKIAAMIFDDIKEAYDVLIDADKRKVYDHKRIAVYGNDSAKLETTAQNIFKDAATLAKIVLLSDPFRLNKEALFVQLKHIANNKNICMLTHSEDKRLTFFIKDMLNCCKPLNYKQSMEICKQLLALTKEYNLAEEKISSFLKGQLRRQQWENNKAIVAVIFTLAICLLMVFLYR